MRLILEQEEIVAILSKHFDADLDPTKVVIRTSPLEIEVHGLPLTVNEPQVKKPKPVEASTVPVPVPETPEAEDVHPTSLLAASKSIERELNNEKAKRRSGAYTYDPPALSEDEMT